MSVPFNDLHLTQDSSETDPLLVTSTDDLSLFGGCINNIEFVVEDGESQSDSIIMQVSDSEETTDQQPIGEDDEIKEEEIEIEELQTQELCVDVASKLLEETSTPISEKVQDDVEDGLEENTLCYVPGCKIDPHKEEILWFTPPKDENFMKIWDICIDRIDKRLDPNDKICEQHFSKEDILREFTFPEKYGNVIVPYEEPKLREGAVPCIKFHKECCVPTCKKKFGRMYCFPVAHKPNFHLWCYMVKNPILKNLKLKELLRHRVCELHFEPSCFGYGLKLHKTAAPTLFLPETQPPLNIVNMKPLSQEDASNLGQTYFSLKCIHGNCNNRANQNKSVFRFPTDPDRRSAWLKACGKEELITVDKHIQELRYNSCGVCEDHFDFHFFEGTLDKLKPGAVPKWYNEESKVVSSQQVEKSSASDTARSPNIANVTMIHPKRKPTITANATCCFKGCVNKLSDKMRFFCFPIEEARYDAWLTACGYTDLSPDEKNDILEKRLICSHHFKKEMFCDSKTKLKDYAVPSNLDSTLSSTDTVHAEGIGDSSNTTLPSQKNTNRVYCAVANCGNFYSSVGRRQGMYYRFPDPINDRERYDIWLKLLANKNLDKKSTSEICQQYMVCFKHFDTIYLNYGVKMITTLGQEAVPTVNLTSDIKWFFESNYYNKRLKDAYENMKDLPGRCEWKKVDTEKDTDVVKTKCVLEEDGIRFPGMGQRLYMGKPVKRDNTGKGKFPYRVYKHFKTGYGLNDDVEVGETIRIHTAIIIDDDDECERAVLQLLLNKRKRGVK